MKRAVILGPGGAGKSTLARRLGAITGITVIELDKVFWQSGLEATPHDQWTVIQRELIGREMWIMDGDLGSYDVLGVRIEAADTVIFLDFSFVRCAWRVIRRLRERADFWLWLWSYRRKSRPLIMNEIAMKADCASIHVLRNPREVTQFVAQVTEDIRASE